MNNESTLLHTGFRDMVLLDPIRQGADNLKIISGYATNTMASWHIKQIAESENRLSPINIILVVGMCGYDGISQSVHEGFKALVARNNTPHQSNFACQYVLDGIPVHSKLYLWERNGHPFCAFMGSANYTQSAFSRSRKELLHECDPLQALGYFKELEGVSIRCDHAEVDDKIIIRPFHPVLEAEESSNVSVSGENVQKVKLSLLKQDGDVGFGSGINWGHRPNGIKREPNQMYIPLPAAISRSDFFPLEGNRAGKDNPHFSVLTDDGINLVLRVEQQGNKAITTPLNNSQIGEYFRNRMNLPNGVFVTKKMLEDYGRTDVAFIKIDEEQYIMDFSV